MTMPRAANAPMTAPQEKSAQESTARTGPATLDASEVAQFAKLSEEWWDENGPFRPLHRLNPTRLTYIRDRLCG
ncbi:MAG: hypothetical protein P8Y82_06775, partial [Methyloceanibacter sp.]